MRPAVEQAQQPALQSSEATSRAAVEMSAVPVLPTTLLGLELLLQRPALDLRAATRLVRDDPGAVLQLFRALAEEAPDETDLPMRLELCLARLPRERLLRLLEGARVSRGSARFARFTEHAARVARCAENVAGALGVAAEPTRLVALLHELGDAPAVLGWSAWPADRTVCCERLARAHGLPAAVRRALEEIHRSSQRSIWTAVIAAAHELLETHA